MSQAPPSPQSTPAEKLLFGRYRVQEQLGETRLATVYRAVDERLQRTVLVHLLRKDLVGQEPLRQRFLDEATASARRSHPALLEVFDSGEVANRPFMITEFVSGRPLRTLGMLTLEDALLYIRQVVGAVATCQSLGVAHPPISSSNVLLVGEGRVKLVESWLTPSGTVALDLAYYRSPERTQGQPPTPATAVYALGLLLYELITGKRAIEGDDARAVAQAHLSAHIPSLSDVRPLLYLPVLERVLTHATARAPEQRPRDAAALAESLDALRREVGADTERLVAPPVQRTRRAQRDADNAPADQTAVFARGAAVQQPRVGTQPLSGIAPNAAPDSLVGSTATTNNRALRQSAQRAVVGWVVALLLLAGVAYGSYIGASYVVDRFFEIKLPQISLPQLSLPWWPSQRQETYIVNAEALNLRTQPGVQTDVVTALPKGTQVVKLEGPRTVDNVPWVRVRAVINDQTFEGWVSEKYLETT